MSSGQIKRVHFVGIGGIGMSALAEVMLSYGYDVSGSDRELSAITQRLERLGVRIFGGHKAANLSGDPQLLVYTSAVGSENPELKAAEARNIPAIKRAELLGEFFRFKKGVAVAGTHGKTTTVGLVSSVLEAGELDPTVIVGGILKASGTNARTGEGPYLVAEADEFDRSFLHIYPCFSVITNVEEDHLDVYKDLKDIREAFVRFANQTSLFGTVILGTDDPEVRRILPRISRRKKTYGFSKEADVRAENLTQFQTKTIFGVFTQEKKLGTAEINLAGEHNVANALAAVAVGLELGLPFEAISRGLTAFQGTGRRLEVLGEKDGVFVIDDYAHHPTEITATLKGLRSGWKKCRIVAVFQPHLFSRTRDFCDEFAKSLTLADQVILTEIYPAREKPIKGVGSRMILDKMKELGFESVALVKKEILVERLLQQKKSGDVIVTLGAGDITQTARRLAEAL